MLVTVEIPDEFADALLPIGEDWGQKMIEACTAQAYRETNLTHDQLRRILDFTNWYEVEAFKNKYDIDCYAVAEFQEDLKTLQLLPKSPSPISG